MTLPIDFQDIDRKIIEESLSRGVHWFFASGIQRWGEDSPHLGGVYSWYDKKAKTFAYLYPEITGYAITFLLFVEKFFPGIVGCAERAAAAAEWIQRGPLDRKSRGIAYRMDPGKENLFPRHSYAFDVGMIVTGLIHLYRKTRHQDWLDLARLLADNLIERMRNRDGSFSPLLDMDSLTLPQGGNKWSQLPGVYHAKLAVPFLLLHEETGESLFAETASSVCRWSLRHQRSDGRFVTNTLDSGTTLHPHCYALEGLLFAGIRLEESAFIDAFKRGLKWLETARLSTGGLPEEYKDGRFSVAERADALAQTVRLQTLAHHHGILEGEEAAGFPRMLTRLLQFQPLFREREMEGGFCFLFDGRGRLLPHANAWVTMFAVQALSMVLSLAKGEKDLGMTWLC